MLRMADAAELQEVVRLRYAQAAKTASAGGCGCQDDGSCCGNIACEGADDAFGASLYGVRERDELPGGVLQASLGCGNPTAVAELKEGEIVLDLGSGGGIDVILSARRVGPSGIAYGVDMTDEMLELARRNAADAGVANAHLLKGMIEQIPLPAASVDVVISNCVINLSIDKAKVFAEIARVLRPGGRIGITDVVADNRLTPDQRAERGSYVGCIAGALSRREYEAGLDASGFEQITVEPTHQVADGMHSVIVRALRRAGS